MRVLVTGAAGFAGRHLCRELSAHGHEVVGFDLAFNRPAEGVARHVTGDLRNANVVRNVMAEAGVEACVHLGGIAFVPAGRYDPSGVLEINTVGAVNVLDAFRDRAPNGRFLLVSSSQIYGLQTAESGAHGEDSPIRPIGMYAISKAAADLATLAYADRYGMSAMTARPGNHIGPGQSPLYVAASFARQMKEIAQGRREPTISVGNLDCRRDFADVRDVVRAYRLLLERGEPGLAYNIGSGALTTIRSLLDGLCRLAGVAPEVRVDPERFRPTDSAPLLDTRRIRERTGWTAEVALEQTLRDMLEQA